MGGSGWQPVFLKVGGGGGGFFIGLNIMNIKGEYNVFSTVISRLGRAPKSRLGSIVGVLDMPQKWGAFCSNQAEITLVIYFMEPKVPPPMPPPPRNSRPY